MHNIYLDANASCPPIKCARQALVKVLDNIGNPSSPHAMGRQARLILDDARSKVAAAIGGEEKQLFFSSGATEGNRWLIDALSKSLLNRPLKVVTSLLEHPSVIKPLLYARDTGLIRLDFLPLFDQQICPSATIDDADALFLTSSHNESGLITNFTPILERLPERTIFICDATQSITRSDILPQRIDAIVLSGHKMGAFPGVGAVLLRNNARSLLPPWTGGGQESSLRPGTEALHLIAALGAVAELASDLRVKYQNIAPLRDKIEQTLCEGRSRVSIIGKKLARLPNTSALVLNDCDGDALRILIDQTKVCVGFGSACSALAPEPSPALLALGLTPGQARSTIRLSLHPDISREDIDEASLRLNSVFDKLLS